MTLKHSNIETSGVQTHSADTFAKLAAKGKRDALRMNSRMNSATHPVHPHILSTEASQ
jgi:hypothetical protein